MKGFIEESCTEEWKEFINSRKKTLKFSKKEAIFKAGEKTQGLFFIDAGKVKVTYKQYDGTDRLIRLATQGDILGHRGFGGSWTYPISAYALEETTISFMSIDTFNLIAKINPIFTFRLMMFFAEELRKSEAKIKHYPVKILVARAIFDNYKVFGFEEKMNSTKLSYTLSRKDLASKAGTTYETVIRSLADFAKNGIIKLDGKSIHILDLEKLKALARPQYKNKD